MKCNNCGADMLLKEKEGSKFWGCPNYKSKGCKTQRYTETTQNGPGTTQEVKGWSKTPNTSNTQQKPNFSPREPLQIIADELSNINKRFDEWEQYFKKELGGE